MIIILTLYEKYNIFIFHIDDSSTEALEDLEIKRNEMRCRCLGNTAQLWVSGTHLVNDFFEQVDFIDKSLNILFEGVVGEGGSGLPRAIFPDFWESFLAKYGKGKGNNYLTITPHSQLSAKHLEAAGRILLLGYVLNGYLPQAFNNVQLYFLLTGIKPSSLFAFLGWYKPRKYFEGINFGGLYRGSENGLGYFFLFF